MINEAGSANSALRQLAKYMLRFRFRPGFKFNDSHQNTENRRKDYSNQVSDLKRTFLPDNQVMRQMNGP